MIASGGGFHLLAGITASTFAPYKALHTGVSCGGPLALGDLDHDGIPDLVGVNATVNQLAILGHAGTLFMQVPVPPTVANITGLSIGEFDGQPGDDIAVSYGGISTEFGVFQGGAAALHYVAVTFPGPCNNAQVQSGHLTGGPVLDLLLSCSDRIQVYKSAGNGTFTLGYPLKLTATQTLVGAPVIADFDGDGTQDVLLLRTDSQVSATNAEAILLRNLSGDGTLQPLDLMVGLPAPGTPAITAAELNGDGKPDVLVVDRASSAKPFHILVNTSI